MAGIPPRYRHTSRSGAARRSADPKLDDPALMLALSSPAFHVGALGGRLTQIKRRERLREAGLSPEQLERLHAPTSLDIGAESPEEIALAIMTQVVEAYLRGD